MGTVFCDNDNKAETIGVSIPGGTFNNVQGIDPAGPTFTPSTAGEGNYSIIYTVNGVASDPVNVSVLPTPSKVDFRVVPPRPVQNGNVFTVTFLPSVEDSNFNYQWTFDTKVFTLGTSTAESPVMQLVKPPKNLKTKVSLKISDKCGTATISHVLLITTETITITG
jgi:hypothetical protein